MGRCVVNSERGGVNGNTPVHGGKKCVVMILVDEFRCIIGRNRREQSFCVMKSLGVPVIQFEI